MKIINSTLIFILIMFGLNSCNKSKKMPTLDQKLNTFSSDYIVLIHAMGLHDNDYVDAYFGPDSLKNEAEKLNWTLEQIDKKNNEYIDFLSKISVPDSNVVGKLRVNFFIGMLQALKMRIKIVNGETPNFDEEAKAIYMADPPHFPKEYFEIAIKKLDSLLPGTGSTYEKYNEFKKQFIIPTGKLDTVFKTAIAETRKRTKKYFDLPLNEYFELEYVTDKAWSGYNWFQGNSVSLVQINTDMPIYIDRAIDLAAHEGYPGHHVYHSTFEQNFVKKKGWLEFSIYPLFSPLGLISEGSANYGIEVAFPGKEKTEYEKTVLYPLAGLNPDLAEKYAKVEELVSKLSYAGNEAARAFLNGDFSEEETIIYLMDYNLMTEERAKQRLSFIKKYRSYVVNYNYGKDLVSKFIKNKGGTPDHPEIRWFLFQDLLSNPYLPNDLK